MSGKRPAAAAPAKAKPRLLKAVVQFTFVTDDGTSLTEVPLNPVTVPAAEWPHFAEHGATQAAESVARLGSQPEIPV